MKRIVSALLIAVCLASMLLSLPFTVSAESLYIRKIVSVVYDDSGSMSGEKHSYANYAMQAFCGMLNSEDQLFITYMNASRYGTTHSPETIDLSAGGIQSSVDSIRSHKSSGGTPYSAVEAAFEKLQSVNDSNPNTQYWLVVITDGSFDEFNYMDDSASKKYLNNTFEDYTNTVMPNGTTPQITFLAIGDSVISPDEDQKQGIYTYAAKNADGIINAMDDMADRISGRTRLSSKDITKVDDRTVQVTSSIPLMNIAVLVQESQAVITDAVYSNEQTIPISREVSLLYPGNSKLVGGAFLLGDSQNVIGSGTYVITFDRTVDLDDVVILFEPALEMRMSVSINGVEVSDYRELDNTAEGDTITISCKIYEMGTDTEISPDLLPPNTTYTITVTEDGKTVEQKVGQDMLLSDYTLSNIETEITASVLIDGFNPIEYSVEFTPSEYVPKVVYTITADYGSDAKSVKYDTISSNTDMRVCFTVYADGVPITDPAALRALNPVVSVSPAGNDGAVTYSNDGKIVYTPNKASLPTTATDSFDVEVSCTISDGTSACAVYTVLIADYQVIPVPTTASLKKTEFYNNQVGVCFYITKDGVQLDKTAVEKYISVELNEAHADLLTDIDVAADGTITITPYCTKEHTLNFWSWWVNWWYYFGLSGEDVTVTLIHAYGSASSVIDVTEEPLLYQVLNVYSPLVIEAAVLAFLIWWIYAIAAKPKFLDNASIYIARLDHAGKIGNYRHEITYVEEVRLSTYNKLKYRWKPTLNPTVINIGRGVSVAAGYGGSLQCMSPVWYMGEIQPKVRGLDFNHPKTVRQYVDDHGQLNIKVINPFDAASFMPTVTINGPDPYTYFVHTELRQLARINNIETIEEGTLFAYVYQENN